MRLLGAFVVACIALAAAQAAAMGLVALLLLALLYATCAYPRETFGLFTLLVVASFIRSYPLVCLSFTLSALTIWLLRPTS